jgi:hypothetical protein
VSLHLIPSLQLPSLVKLFPLKASVPTVMNILVSFALTLLSDVSLTDRLVRAPFALILTGGSFAEMQNGKRDPPCRFALMTRVMHSRRFAGPRLMSRGLIEHRRSFLIGTIGVQHRFYGTAERLSRDNHTSSASYAIRNGSCLNRVSLR